MTTRIARVLCVCLICSAVISSTALAETRTTPVEVQNTPTVGISPTDNMVQNQPKSLRVNPLTTTLSVAANGVGYTPDVNCAGYKEARIVIYSNFLYTVAQNVTVGFYYDSVLLGTMPWWSIGGGENQYGLSPICTSFSAILPVMGNTLKIRINNGNSDSGVTIQPAMCWVYLVN